MIGQHRLIHGVSTPLNSLFSKNHLPVMFHVVCKLSAVKISHCLSKYRLLTLIQYATDTLWGSEFSATVIISVVVCVYQHGIITGHEM